MTNPYINLLRTAWRYAKNERKKYVLVYAMFFTGNLIDSLNPILYGWFIGSVQRDTGRILHYAWLFAGGFVGIKFLHWCLHGPARMMERKLAFQLGRNFLRERYHQALHLPVKWHQDHHSGATINRIRKAYEALREFFDRGFMYIHALSKFLISVVAMIYFSPVYGGVAVLLGFACIWVIRVFDRPFVTALDEVNEREHILSSTLFDSLSNIMTVITLRLEKSMEKELLGKIQRIARPFRRSALINEWKWFSAEMIIVIIYAVIAVGYVYQHWEAGKVFYIGGLVTLLAYVLQFTSVFQDIAWQYTEIVQFNTSVMTATEIDTAYSRQHRADLPRGLPEDWQEIWITGVNFSHREGMTRGVGTPAGQDDAVTDEEGNVANQEGNVANQEGAVEGKEHGSSGKKSDHAQRLQNMHLRLQKGKRIALIGASGSGKSTLLALLRGLYIPEPGFELTVDGRPELMEALNEAVTLFPQEPEIFENTLNYNITLGLPVDREEILEVCRAAYFTEVIGQLPAGLDSDIREKGVNLSGGQKQRLALARGILAARDSDVVLLDEPTSSVDPRTEALIYEGMFRSFRDKVIVSSMHRLHLLRHFDYVYVLDQGRIVDEGAFEYLRDNSSAFQELWRHQLDAAQ